MTTEDPRFRDPSMDYELIYPSGHSQLVGRIETDIPHISFYHCHTLSPDGDPLEFRILSEEQLQRTIKRVQRLGGKIRHKTSSDGQ
ncbi:MAG: hypothetical protein WCA08_15145 [Desulfoferrobacter sp.]